MTFFVDFLFSANGLEELYLNITWYFSVAQLTYVLKHDGTCVLIKWGLKHSLNIYNL